MKLMQRGFDPPQIRSTFGSGISPLQVLLDDVGLGEGTSTVNSVLASSGKAVLSVDTLNTVGGVDVLDKGELPASGTTLARGDGGGSKEVLPNAEPALAVLGLDLVTVAHPVPVPAPEGSRVVHTDGVDGLDLESGTLKTVHDETKRGTGISTGEDVLVHEKTPDKVLVLPRLAETSDLQEESTVVVEHVVDLREERREVTNTNVLGHLETGDLLVSTVDTGSITVVGADNATLALLNTGLAETVVTPGCLVTTKSDTGDVSAVVSGRVLSESSPATAKIENLVTGLDTDLLTNNGQLVVLKLLKGLLLVDITNNTGGVDHAGTKEPSVEVVTAVVVVTNLLLV